MKKNNLYKKDQQALAWLNFSTRVWLGPNNLQTPFAT